ncbi:tetratricopeptide repeat protein [Tamlana crocina]|uniref:Tetratricopeptide repeat protein n=1 Tax=Tamlana crocina TaxID=393006 RepID=A0ABX1DFW3_9FLAO|nr:tetratricopeptide repeat protein [Tamlana crocina]NJX16146.1 tetratricopeptide repeat protein [Tamlana crocina]
MKNKILLLLIIVPFIGFAQVNKLLRQAKRSNNSNEKIELLTQAIALEPKNWDAYFYRALAKNDMGDYGGAIVDYSKIIVEAPDADTYYNRGNSRFSIKDFTGAKEDYAKAYMLDDSFIDALYSLACVKFELGEYEEAIEDFNTVIKKVPNQPNTYILRAAAYRALENYEKAAQDYSTAIYIEPSADAFYNRGAFYMDIKYYQQANDDLNKAIRLNSNHAFAYFYRGASHLMLGKFTDAISDFNKSIAFDANDFDARLGLAIAYYKLKDVENAKTNFKRANNILSIPQDVNTIEHYSNTYWFQNQYYYFSNNIGLIAKL